MKYIIFWMMIFIPFAGGLFGGCANPGGYKFNGVVDGVNDGKVFILKQKFTREDWDTLVSGVVKEGKFKIKGEIQEPTVGLIGMNGMMGTIVFLERGAEFQVKLNARNMPVVTGGGKEQALFQAYVDISNRMLKEYDKYSPEMLKAMQEGNEERQRELQESMEKMRKAYEEEQAAFLKQHGNSFFALFQLATKALGMDVNAVEEIFNLCDDNLKNTEPGKYVRSLIPKLARIALGMRVPDFTAETAEGTSISLYKIKGKVKLLDFWASNCGMCREEIRRIIPLYNQYKSDGFEVLAFSFDKDREVWLRAISEDAAPWLQVSDLKGTKSPLCQTFGVLSLPANLLLDENNKVLARNINSEQLKEMLPKYLNLK